MLTAELVGESPEQITDFDRLLFNHLCSFEAFGAQTVQLHQFGVSENHADAVVQVMQTLPYLILIHT